MTINNAVETTVKLAQQLQTRRENWKKTLDAIPMPKAKMDEFPYASMDAAIKNDFALFLGGKDEAFALLVKGFKTRAWRKAAEKNRDARDEFADGEVPVPAAKRVAKKIEAVKKEAAAEAKTEAAAQ
jgi:hypothetical protein